MSSVNNLVDQKIRQKVERDVVDSGGELTCDEIQPSNSEFKGEGEARCVFEKNGHIVKISKNQEGVIQTHGAQKVKDKVEEHDDILAMPKDVKEGVAVVQEKITPYSETVDDEKVNKLALQSRGLSRLEPKHMRLNNKLVKLRQEDGVRCEDAKNPHNWGIKDSNLALLDLGDCS